MPARSKARTYMVREQYVDAPYLDDEYECDAERVKDLFPDLAPLVTDRYFVQVTLVSKGISIEIERKEQQDAL